MEEVIAGVRWLLGLGVEDLSLWRMAIRALVVYVAALAMVRLGEKRFRGENTAFDTQGRTSDVSQVREARLERSGNISVLRKDSEAKVLEVSVAEGVQTVRIQIE